MRNHVQSRKKQYDSSRRWSRTVCYALNTSPNLYAHLWSRLIQRWSLIFESSCHPLPLPPPSTKVTICARLKRIEFFTKQAQNIYRKIIILQRSHQGSEFYLGHFHLSNPFRDATQSFFCNHYDNTYCTSHIKYRLRDASSNAGCMTCSNVSTTGRTWLKTTTLHPPGAQAVHRTGVKTNVTKVYRWFNRKNTPEFVFMGILVLMSKPSKQIWYVFFVMGQYWKLARVISTCKMSASRAANLSLDHSILPLEFLQISAMIMYSNLKARPSNLPADTPISSTWQQQHTNEELVTSPTSQRNNCRLHRTFFFETPTRLERAHSTYRLLVCNACALKNWRTTEQTCVESTIAWFVTLDCEQENATPQLRGSSPQALRGTMHLRAPNRNRKLVFTCATPWKDKSITSVGEYEGFSYTL